MFGKEIFNRVTEKCMQQNKVRTTPLDPREYGLSRRERRLLKRKGYGKQ